MGTKARDKRKRRELAQQHTRQMVAGDAAARADPARMALATAQAGDPRAVACRDAPGNRLRLIHSVAVAADDQVWAHISVSNPDGSMPDWYDVREAGWLLYPGRPGVIVVAAQDTHVNLGNVHHIWYCLTKPSVPDFSSGTGSI